MTHHPTHREAQAAAEVGKTAVRRSVAIGMCVLFVLLLVSLFGWELLHRRADGMRGGTYLLDATQGLVRSVGHFPSHVASGGLWEGLGQSNHELKTQLTVLESGLKMEAPWRLPLLTPMNRGLSGVLGASNANVYMGKEDWLFYGPALRHVLGRSVVTASPDAMEVLLAFQETLAARGIALVIVPIPSKVSLYPDRLSGRVQADVVPRNQGYTAWMEAYRAAGGVAFDPTPALMEARAAGAAYLRRDSHWTPQGVDYSAKALADLLEERVDFSEIARRIYRHGKPETVAYPGDLATMLYPGEASGTSMDEVVIAPVEDGDGVPWEPERGSEVLLLGDSFTNIYSQAALGWGTGAGFAEQLSLHLQRPVDRIAQNDHGAYAARHRLQASVAQGEDLLAHTRVVVYEFAVRELSWGDWKPNRHMVPAAGNVAPRAPDGAMTVSGHVVARSLPPAPRSVPYKDCLISVLLEPESGDGEKILFYAHGMVDHQWTAATNWRVGDRITVSLTPWADVPHALESLNRMDLEGEALHDRTPWWYPEGGKVVTLIDPDTPPPVSEVMNHRESLSARITRKEEAGEMVISGQAEWLYFVPALRSLSVGEFWGAAAPAVSRARNAQWADPLPAIIDFHQQLATANITLLLVPVPTKAAVYPEHLGAPLAEGVEALAGAQGAHRRVLEVLRESGVSVVDLQPLFESLPDNTLAYCKTDTHWSPAGAALAAREVARVIRELPGVALPERERFRRQDETLNIQGDLAVLAGRTEAAETLPFGRVGREEGGQLVPVMPDRDSPILLIGDSHNLVFHAGGDMHATEGGLPDLLALELGMAVDLVAVRGSGATTPRINLARRGDQLAGKNVVIWCFSAREFTESVTGWRTIPVIP